MSDEDATAVGSVHHPIVDGTNEKYCLWFTAAGGVSFTPYPSADHTADPANQPASWAATPASISCCSTSWARSRSTPRGAELLYQIITERKERASVGIGTNLIVDRVTFNAHIPGNRHPVLPATHQQDRQPQQETS